MASKLSGWVDEAVGAALVVAGVALIWYCPPLAPYVISAGVGLMMTGVGTLISSMGGLTGVHTLSRNPIKPWDVIYGRARVAGTNLYTKEWGNNNKYLDIVAVLACHPCQDVYGILFNGRMVQIDTTAVPSGVPASTFPAINGGTSFSPLQESHTCSLIIRANNVVTVTTQDIPLLIVNEYVNMSEVTADPTLNGTFAVSSILSRSGGNITFQYICGGLPITISGSQGIITTMWVDYGRHVYVETMLGNQTLGTTFVGMTIGTPNEGDPTDLQHPPVNPWTANCSAVGRTVVFIRLNYDSTIFANGVPEISFLVHGKNNITDPRTSPATVGYSENSALCFADYMTDQKIGFRCALGVEIDIDELTIDANICDETVTLAAGGTEPRYTCNGQFEVSRTRGEILLQILSSCGGRLTTAAGKFRCNPAAYPGISFILAGQAGGGFPGWGLAGWGLRASQTASGRYLWSYDALGTYIGAFGADITWDVFCPAINQAVLIALETTGGAGAAAFVQSASSASASVAFPSANAAGNCIVADITFTAGTYTAGPVTVTDSNGNTYSLAAGGPAPFQGTFLMTFVASNCAPGANTVTATMGGSFPFVEVTVDITEYLNVTGVVNASEYSDGGTFGTGNTVNVSVTPDTFCVMHLAVASGCVSIAIAGGAEAPVGPMQILANSFRWRPKASVHDLFNAVKGTYVSPATNWQVSDFPPYMQDNLHGYESGSPVYPFGDANLEEDGGQRRFLDIQLPMTISCATAQRLAKIELLRRRQQGTGTFPFNLWATRLTALDIVAMTLPYFDWVGKLLEIAAWRFTFTESNGLVALATEVDLQETDPSIYAWSPGTEELTPQGYNSPSGDPPGTGSNLTSIAGPTGVTLLSDSTTVSIGGGSISGSQIKVSWTAPLDAYLSYVQIQYQVYSSPLGTAWLQGPNAPPNVSIAFIPNVVNGTAYEIQIRSVDVNGAASPWVQYGPVTAGGATGQLFTVNGS